MSILGGLAIIDAIDKGDIVIDPFEPKRVNPVSVDLTLGDRCALYHHPEDKFSPPDTLDARKKNVTTELNFKRIRLLPGTLYLMHTRERVCTNKYVPIVDGKSSVGRFGVQVHMTAGFGDPGFDGQYTLEVVCVHPIWLYSGMSICQIRFETIEGAFLLYDGNYKKGTAMGPVASMSWKQQ